MHVKRRKKCMRERLGFHFFIPTIYVVFRNIDLWFSWVHARIKESLSFLFWFEKVRKIVWTLLNACWYHDRFPLQLSQMEFWFLNLKNYYWILCFLRLCFRVCMLLVPTWASMKPFFNFLINLIQFREYFLNTIQRELNELY